MDPFPIKECATSPASRPTTFEIPNLTEAASQSARSAPKSIMGIPQLGSVCFIAPPIPNTTMPTTPLKFAGLIAPPLGCEIHRAESV